MKTQFWSAGETRRLLVSLCGAVLILLTYWSSAEATVACKNKKGDVSVREACQEGELIVVQEADDTIVSGCTFLTTVQASSGWGGLAAGKGMNNARKSLFSQAAKKGATHLVVASVSGGYSPSASAKAYRCPPPPEK